MGKYVYAPAGARVLRSDLLLRCIEYIGELQPGIGSNEAKGKRYLRKHIEGCSGRMIKRTAKICKKVRQHDFEQYGLDVYYYSPEMSARILEVTTEFMRRASQNALKKEVLGCIPRDNEYLQLLYGHRLSQLSWVIETDYYGQEQDARIIAQEIEYLKNHHSLSPD